jgi:hypothetical protein
MGSDVSAEGKEIIHGEPCMMDTLRMTWDK